MALPASTRGHQRTQSRHSAKTDQQDHEWPMRQRQRQELQSSSVVSTAISHLGGVSQNFFQINRHEKMGVCNSCQLPRGAKRQANDEKKGDTLPFAASKGRRLRFSKGFRRAFSTKFKKTKMFLIASVSGQPLVCQTAGEPATKVHPSTHSRSKLVKKILHSTPLSRAFHAGTRTVGPKIHLPHFTKPAIALIG